MEVKDLVGLHYLTGVDYGTQGGSHLWDRDANVISFILDGITYSAVEDPNDGYRSMMADLFVSEVEINNTFEPNQVMGILRGRNNYEDNDVIDFYDTKNGKIVLSVGTGNTNDYYPYFVYAFTPENMSINDGRS